ncbi:MAG: hypothetical protein ABSB74_18085 [Tepidisphaeraceae bacterium]
MSVCLRCGYDLRATPADAPCPECGLAAHRSVIEHSHPDDCPPRWVAMIAAASVLLLISYAGFALFLVVGLSGPMRGLWGDVLFYGLQVLAVLHAAANFLLARDDRRGASKGIWRVHRWLLWIVPLLPIAGLAVILLYSLQFMLRFLFPRTLWWVGGMEDLSLGLVLAAVLCPAITFFRLRWLALRLSRPRLAEHVTIVAVGCSASFVLLIVCAFAGWDEIRRADIYFFLMLVLPVALVALFNLWAMLLLFVVSQRFLQSAREARARWRAADASWVKS